MLFAVSISRGIIESEAVSGNESQYVFSEGDVQDSDADLVNRFIPGEFSIPQSFGLL